MTDLERKQSQLIYDLRHGKVKLENENRHLRNALQRIKELEPLNHVVINEIAKEALND